MGSCDECLGTGFSDCADLFNFRLINRVNNQDLVFGRNSVYQKDSVYLFTTYPGYPGNHISYSDSSEFHSQFELPVDTLYLHLDSADTDTLFMKYKFKKSTCCRTGTGYGRITEIRFNGIVAKKQDDVFIFEK